MVFAQELLTFSIVIPAYNEQDRLIPYLTSITGYLSQRRERFEIVVVDDGSRDETVRAVIRFAASVPALRLIRLPLNRGKGAAVRTGMQAARGSLRLMTDADGATPIEELARLEQAVANGADIAIGSRFLGARDHRYRVKARWHRSVFGNLFNQVVQRLGLRGIMDTQCGFKLFRKHAAEDLFSVARVDGYGFDLELLYIARRRDYRIAEVPINWSDQPGSKVRIARDGWRMLRDLLTVRRDEANGVYSPRQVSELVDDLRDTADSRF